MKVIPRRSVILDLCGGYGSWSRLYRQNGYTVIVVEIDRHFKPDFLGTVSDFYRRLVSGRLVLPPVRGILASPPFTSLARIEDQPPQDRDYDWNVIIGCHDIIRFVRPKWWALESPRGFLTTLLGPHSWHYQPFEYGDPRPKLTCIWGSAVQPPVTNPVKPTNRRRKHKNTPAKIRRFAETTPGFARAFFHANP